MKKKTGRPINGNIPITISVPKDFVKKIEEIGFGSKSLGVQRLWKKIKNIDLAKEITEE